jgi:hypothetical protein
MHAEILGSQMAFPSTEPQSELLIIYTRANPLSSMHRTHGDFQKGISTSPYPMSPSAEQGPPPPNRCNKNQIKTHQINAAAKGRKEDKRQDQMR